MKKSLYLFILLLAGCQAAMAQVAKPKQHVFYDTVKTVQTRVDYSPDTIPVYFKEIRIIKMEDGSVHPEEQLMSGYVIWQTYRKNQFATFTGTSSIGLSSYSTTYPEFYTQTYSDNSLSGQFLYLDKKPVTNKVIYAIKH